MILYSAAYGQTALDRLNDADPEPTSVFTRVLARKIAEAGKPLRDVAYEVKEEVRALARTVNHDQRPAVYDELDGAFFFRKDDEAERKTANAEPAKPQADTQPAPPPPAPLAEREAFETAVSINTPAAYQAFLKRFPSGFYADMAKAAEEKILQASEKNEREEMAARATGERAREQKAAREAEKVARVDPRPAPSREPASETSAPPSVGSSLWSHNGSVMSLSAEGATRRFTYHRPRSGIARQGATRGALLFEGHRSGDTYSGTAYIFSRNCGKFPYRVSGSVQNGDRRVVMRGKAPKPNDDCRIAGYRADTLVFDYLSSTR